MPIINISTSVKIKNKKDFLEKSTDILASLTNKSKKFVMAKIEDCLEMYFAEDNSPCCYVEIKSIGSLKPANMSKPLCEFISNELGISINRIYISFEDIPAKMWGWNGKTFG